MRKANIQLNNDYLKSIFTITMPENMLLTEHKKIPTAGCEDFIYHFKKFSIRDMISEVYFSMYVSDDE